MHHQTHNPHTDSDLSGLVCKCSVYGQWYGIAICPFGRYESGRPFTITNTYLNEHLLPRNGWDYSTFGYGFGITFWSRLEVNYVCTLFWGDWSPHAQGPNGTYCEKIMKNQDRHFSAKVLALKEGEIWKWTPSFAFGLRTSAIRASSIALGLASVRVIPNT